MLTIFGSRRGGRPPTKENNHASVTIACVARSACLAHCCLGPRERLVRHAVSLALSLLVVVFASLRLTSYRLNHRALVKLPINDIPRECPPPEYPVVGRPSSTSSSSSSNHSNPKICITTLTDAEEADWWQRLVRWRDFGNLLDMTWPNKQRYCAKHGYKLFNESAQLDNSRPPSWSKIRAARRLLTEEDCDWVYWMDADTVIMNSAKRIEDFLPAPETGIDLILSEQKGPSWNAGAWFVRRTEWSLRFLDRWWDMTDFVKPKGLAESGDNHALRTLLRGMDGAEFAAHIAAPPRCLFNSVAKFMTQRERDQLTDEMVRTQEWYMNLERYHKGDLVAHVAGVDNKIATSEMLLKDAI